MLNCTCGSSKRRRRLQLKHHDTIFLVKITNRRDPHCHDNSIPTNITNRSDPHYHDNNRFLIHITNRTDSRLVGNRNDTPFTTSSIFGFRLFSSAFGGASSC